MTEKKISDLPMIEPDEIRQENDIPVLFIRRTGNYDVSSRAAWDVVAALIKENKLEDAKLRYFTIAHDDPKITTEENLRFDACVQEDPRIPVKGELARKVIPGGKYAIFTHHGGTDTLIQTYNRIFFKWLPDSKENFDTKRICFIEHVDGKYDEKNKIYVPLI